MRAAIIIFFLYMVLDKRPAKGEKNIYDKTYNPEAIDTIIDSLPLATQLIASRQINVLKKLLLKTPRKLLANKGIHFVFDCMLVLLVIFCCFYTIEIINENDF
jgi:hypothetical protein